MENADGRWRKSSKDHGTPRIHLAVARLWQKDTAALSQPTSRRVESEIRNEEQFLTLPLGLDQRSLNSFNTEAVFVIGQNGQLRCACSGDPTAFNSPACRNSTGKMLDHIGTA